MNLGEFHAMVKASLARGDALDGIIPSFTKMAVQFMERNYTFQYMRQFLTFEVDLEIATTPRYIELGGGVPKAIPFVRLLEDGDSSGEHLYTNLRRVDPSDADSLLTGFPETYWLDGIRRLVLNRTPDENLSGEIRIDRYTAWPTALTFNHYLLDMASDVLLGQTLVLLSARLRDPRLRETYSQMRDEGLKTLLLADEELQQAGQSAEMEYLPSR